MSNINNVKQLRALYAANQNVKAILDCFASRERNATVTKVDRLFSILDTSGASVSRWNLVKALRELSDLGYGRFVVGRKGHPSRVEWNVEIVSLGKAGTGATDVIQVAKNDDAELEVEEDLVRTESTSCASSVPMMKVRYPLRAELEVELALPKNLTRREAERLSDFIKTLPFEDLVPAA